MHGHGQRSAHAAISWRSGERMSEIHGTGEDRAAAERGRLRAHPDAATPGAPQAAGLQAIGLGGQRDGLLLVPEAVAEGALPLIVMLHGAGGDAAGALELIRDAAPGVLILAPESRGRSWDVILGAYGPDVAFLDAALHAVFARHRVDRRRVALAGFSDGASYALSLALGNGDLITHAIAFSPGFVAPPEPVGRPILFVSHGVADRVLPIEACSRRLVPRLRAGGYTVHYREFPDGHVVPAWVAREAVDLLAKG